MTVAVKPHTNGKKAPPKTGRNTGQFAKGADARRGAGRKGRSGRKSLAFAEACAHLVDTLVLPKVQSYLANGHRADDPAWRWCAEYVTNYGKGKPPQQVQVTGEDGGPLEIKHTIAFGDTIVEF